MLSDPSQRGGSQTLCKKSYHCLNARFNNCYVELNAIFGESVSVEIHQRCATDALASKFNRQYSYDVVQWFDSKRSLIIIGWHFVVWKNKSFNTAGVEIALRFCFNNAAKWMELTGTDLNKRI